MMSYEPLPIGAVKFIGPGRVQLALYKQTRYHWCPICNAWNIGDPISRVECEDHQILCGRRGTAYSCISSKHEIGFDGCYF